jgi:hypothetical protein
VCMFWISTKPCKTPAEGMNAYVILWLSVNLGVYCSLEKSDFVTRFVAHSITKIIIHSWDQSRQFSCKFHYEYTTAKLFLSCLFHFFSSLHFTSIYFTSHMCTPLLLLSASTRSGNELSY